ncbi:hypothetical protein HanIR_Chr12g0615461 [Helianthus annuus]|nr:hypothetical protein HanIR_Chr12g0615461 [Helianthus annuus]
MCLIYQICVFIFNLCGSIKLWEDRDRITTRRSKKVTLFFYLLFSYLISITFLILSLIRILGYELGPRTF